MKKLIFGFIALTIVPMTTNAAFNCCSMQTCIDTGLIGSSVKYSPDCSSIICSTCNNETTTNLFGIKVTIVRSLHQWCENGTEMIDCVQGATTYSCDAGYYGTATSASAGCTKCPNNATCDGGNGSTFKCNIGYYLSGADCKACPQSGTTAGPGATNINECYFPSGSSFSDNYGSGTYTGNCYY